MLKNLSKPSWANLFSHLYIEEGVKHELLTKKIVKKFSESKIIYILNTIKIFLIAQIMIKQAIKYIKKEKVRTWQLQ